MAELDTTADKLLFVEGQYCVNVVDPFLLQDRGVHVVEACPIEDLDEHIRCTDPALFRLTTLKAGELLVAGLSNRVGPGALVLSGRPGLGVLWGAYTACTQHAM